MAVDPGHDRVDDVAVGAVAASSKSPRIWALLGPHQGDNNQVLALAEALGLPFEQKHLRYTLIRHLRPRFLRATFASLDRLSRNAIAGRPPDLTISTGVRSVPVVRALRARSGGNMKAVHLGDPRVSLGLFDLVYPTPEYPAYDDPRALRLPLSLVRSPPAPHASEIDALDRALPEPRHMIVVGGHTLFWRLHIGDVAAAIAEEEGKAQAQGGSLIVVTSPRTPPKIARWIERRLARSPIPAGTFAPNSSPSYGALIGASTSVRVTSDSVAMVSDAIAAKRFSGRIAVQPSPVGHIYLWLLRLFAPARRMRPRDLRRFWWVIDELDQSSFPGSARMVEQVVAQVTDILR